MSSELEQTFYDLWDAYYPDIDLHTEHYFAKPRQHRFDLAHIPTMIAVELQGSIWVSGRHSRGSGLLREYEKMNLAASLGWRVFYLCTNTVEDETIYHQIATAIRQSEAIKKMGEIPKTT